MDKKIPELIWLFMLFFIMAATEGSAFEEASLPVASDAITFEQNFDSKSALPEMATGNAAPLLIFGKQSYAKGLSGYALFCGKGGAKIRYSAQNNIDFDKPGAVSLWFFTDNWQKSTGMPRVLFFATECSKGYIGAETENDPKNIPLLERKIRLRILYSKLIPDGYLALSALGPKADNMWHLLVFAWHGNSIYMSLDGAPFSSKVLPSKISTKALPSTDFSIGTEAFQNYLLDEVRIYSRKLSNIEVKAIWEKGNMEINKNKQREVK
ncbi:MAG: LamG-like jellyroll fold domain-containing protein [Victivallaceae bacterium]